MNRKLALAGLIGVIGLIVFSTFNNPRPILHAQDGEDCGPPPGIRFADFWADTNFCQSNIDLSEVISGGPPPDGIPPIDAPVYETVVDASEWLNDQSPVISVTVNDETAAYPLGILTWHEIVNTELGGEPITVTFCPLCNSAIVFDRNVNGDVLDFGVSGNLRNSDLIMYDRQTRSWWQQFTGEGIVGEYTDTMLEMVPSQVIGFGQFADEHPEARVISRETGASRSYGSNPYAGYDSTDNPFLFTGELDDRLPATARVLAGFVGSEAVAYPFGVLREEVVVNDTVSDLDIVALWQPGTTSALDQRSIDDSRDVGTAALFSREIEDGTVLTFAVGEDNSIVDEETGSTWNAFGRATSGELEGTELRQIVANGHFWFAWNAFEPDSILYGIG